MASFYHLVRSWFLLLFAPWCFFFLDFSVIMVILAVYLIIFRGSTVQYIHGMRFMALGSGILGSGILEWDGMGMGWDGMG